MVIPTITITITGTIIITMTDASRRDAALYRLLAWMSPSFPVGAFTYSHGLEWAVEEGAVADAQSLRAWISDVMRYGSGRSDAILLARVHEAFLASDLIAVREMADLAVALQPSKERHLEATAQGAAFVVALEAAWPAGEAMADRLLALKGGDGIDRWAYAIAVGVHCAAHDIDAELAVSAYLHAFAANLVSAAVRAVPLGQSDGQRVLAALEPVIADVAGEALAASLDDLGSASFRADISSQLHETQYTRLFRS